MVASSLAENDLAPRAYKPLPLGSISPQGWILDQLILQANALSGVLSKSTFPGAITVNTSLWVGGNGTAGGNTDQWLPYWTNGNVPLLELIRAAGPAATDRLDPALDLVHVMEEIIDYVITNTNKTNGWIGPFINEPGDTNGHGLWDPLNMLRTRRKKGLILLPAKLLSSPF